MNICLENLDMKISASHIEELRINTIKMGDFIANKSGLEAKETLVHFAMGLINLLKEDVSPLRAYYIISMVLEYIISEQFEKQG